MTVRDVDADLARYVSAEHRGYPPGEDGDDRIPDALAAINGAIAECGTLGPIFWFKGQKSALIRASVTLAVTGGWTAGATTITLPAGETWLVGCSIKVGSEPWNEVVAFNAGTTVATLRNPFMDAGTGSAIVYCDSVQCESDVLQVLDPVDIVDVKNLRAIANRQMLNHGRYDSWRDDDYGRASPTTQATRRTSIHDVPTWYWTEGVYRTTTAPAVKHIRLAPMPSAKNILQYSARLTPPKYVRTDIYATATPTIDPGVEVPFDSTLMDKVFLPIARYHFTQTASFRFEEKVKLIAAAYESAIEAGRQMQPQAAGGIVFKPGP